MELYHLVNRGVDKRNIFMDTGDYVRFVHSLYAFNNTKAANNTEWRRAHNNNDIVSRYSREPIVDIHAWCLMKNHYHLLVSERKEGGLTLFIRKLNIGYAKFFNEKYKRDGTLFQGRTKKILIERDAQFNYIFHYIHLNPLDYLKGASEWRIRSKGGVRNIPDTLKYLRGYRWSSYLDYIGEKNFPSVITTNIFPHVSHDYAESIEKFLKTADREVLLPSAFE